MPISVTHGPTDSTRLSLLRRALRAWYRRHARTLPWRGTRDPYRVWVSEIMLQQTQVETVKPYYTRFAKHFPTIAALAKAPEQDVLRLWEGLGYYRRARQLHEAARQIVAEHNGVFPTDAEAVRRLPGIGRYTAGAILSIAFDQQLPILEANTVRLFARLLAYSGDPHSGVGQKTLWEFAERILPRTRSGEFNQALMELGSLVCIPRAPNCDECPLVPYCPTRAAGLQAQIPRAKKKRDFEEVREVAVIVRRNGAVLLRQCATGERWAGLWDFPRFALPASQPQSENTAIAKQVHDLTGVRIGATTAVATFKHGVTRFRITLHCFSSRAVPGGHLRRSATMRWVRPEHLEEYPLSATGRKISRLLREAPCS